MLNPEGIFSRAVQLGELFLTWFANVLHLGAAVRAFYGLALCLDPFTTVYTLIDIGRFSLRGIVLGHTSVLGSNARKCSAVICLFSADGSPIEPQVWGVADSG